MNCEKAKIHMVEFLYGEISNDIAEELYKHLQECEKCSDTINEMKHINRLMHKIPKISDSSIIWKTPHLVNKSEHQYYKVFITSAAVIVLAILSLFVILNTSYNYENGVVSVKFGTEKQSIPSEFESTYSPHVLTNSEVDEILQYFNDFENKYNTEHIMLATQYEKLANSIMYEFQKRDEILQWLLSNYPVMVQQTSLKK
jgi:hypothetical protein